CSRTRATAMTPWGVTVWLRALNTRSARTTVLSAGTSKRSPSRTASSSNETPASAASRTTRGPSRSAAPGDRRWARRRRYLTASLSGLLIFSWSEAVLRNLHQPGKRAAVAHGQVSQHLAVDLHPGLAKA